MGVRDHQLDATKAESLVQAHGFGPERLCHRFSALLPEDLPPSARRAPNRKDDSLGDDPEADTGLTVGGVEEHVRVGLIRQRAVPKRRNALIGVRADPRHLAL